MLHNRKSQVDCQRRIGFAMAATGFDNQLSEKCRAVNDVLRELLVQRGDIDADLKKALEYALGPPQAGKRIRPALALWSCELVAGVVNRSAEVSAAAIEMVHTYSLIHDDLPAMDDDDLRRGRPSCHKAFDEATAILAGDGLLTLAFEVLAREIDRAGVAVRLIGELAEAAGAAGMIAGQMADLRAERSACSKELLESIATNKTAKMFRCSCAMGAICGGARRQEYEMLCEYGLKIGMGFQIADDVLDVSGVSEHLGKTAGKDAKAGKCTYPKILGMAESKQLAARIAVEAGAILEPFGQRADSLRQLAKALLQRTR